MDRYSPVAPAFVRVQLLPIGSRTSRSLFVRLLRRLQREVSILPLSELNSHDKNLGSLSPDIFPRGSILFNFTTFAPPDDQQHIAPFELFREPLIVLGVVGGLSDDGEQREQELRDAATQLRERHPRVVHRHLLVVHRDDQTAPSDIAIRVENPMVEDDPSLLLATRQLCISFLQDLVTYTAAMHAAPTVQTPGQTSRGLQKAAFPLRVEDRRPGSSQGVLTPGVNTAASSPINESGHSRQSSGSVSSLPPPTSFDQIQPANGHLPPVTRSDSRAGSKTKGHKRSSSQDQVAAQGFGPGTSQEKARQRGRARGGIVIGHIHLMAGQWNETLKLLIENTARARQLQDHIWHAKGLEGIVVCLMLLGWAGMEFSLPSICAPISERHHSPRNSLTSANSDPNPTDPSNNANHGSIMKLSAALPELTKLILSLLRSGEGPLELPLLVMYEATLRMSKLWTILRCCPDHQLSRTALRDLIESQSNAVWLLSTKTSGSGACSRNYIADVLNNVQPTSAEGVSAADRVAILSGVASIYDMLRMDRKKAVTIREIVMSLTTALSQARKLGAAEAGIHPAASLSADTGADQILAVVAENDGVNVLMATVAEIYGSSLPNHTTDDSARVQEPSLRPDVFGHDSLKLEILRCLLAFCEASPDPYGVVRLASALLRSAKQINAVDLESDTSIVNLRRDEQIRLGATITRTVGVSKNLGLPDVKTSYWDPFLVRGLEFLPGDPVQSVLRRSKLSAATDVDDGRQPGNPLLYDPNASRPGTAEPERAVLVQDEASVCNVLLQNPYDIPVEIEAFTLVTEGVQLEVTHQSFTLGPSRLEQVLFMVVARSAGECKIVACRVQITGCHEQAFSIFEKPWTPSRPIITKGLGLAGRNHLEDTRPGMKSKGPIPMTVPAVIVPAQPILEVDHVGVLESNLMLLDGEKHMVDITLRNVSSVSAIIFKTIGTNKVFSLVNDSEDGMLVPSKATQTLSFEVTGTPGVFDIQADIYYSSTDAGGDFARMVSAKLEMTVNAALRVQQVDAIPAKTTDHVVISFDLGNAWPKPLTYHCSTLPSSETDRESDPISSSSPSSSDPSPFQSAHGVLAPGEVERVYLSLRRWPALALAADPDAVRDQLASRLDLRWSADHDRHGHVDARALPLTADALAVVRGTPVRVSLHPILDDDGDDGDGERRLLAGRGDAGCVVPVASFLVVRARLTNRTKEALGPLDVRLRARTAAMGDFRAERAVTADADADDDDDDDGNVAVAGSLDRFVPVLRPSETVEVDFVVCPLVATTLTLRAVVRVARWDDGVGREGEGKGDWQAVEVLSVEVIQ